MKTSLVYVEVLTSQDPPAWGIHSLFIYATVRSNRGRCKKLTLCSRRPCGTFTNMELQENDINPAINQHYFLDPKAFILGSQ